MGRKALALTVDCFLCGTLLDDGLRQLVLNAAVPAQPAVLPDHALVWSGQGPYPALVAREGAEAVGLLASGLSAAQVARLDLYQSCVGNLAGKGAVRLSPGGAVAAQVYRPKPGAEPEPAALPWDWADWQHRFADEFRATVQDLFAAQPHQPAPDLAARFPVMLVRGASRLRAAQAAPTTLRHRASAGDVRVSATRAPYAQFFAVEEIDLSFRRFDRRFSPEVTRAVFVGCDAVTVLPYDPVRDRVLVVDQFRAGPLARGDAQPWQIEAIAGRIDPGETPEMAARREAVEEAGLRLDALEPVARYYPTPGALAEFLYSFVAVTDLPDGAAGVFGVEGEAENIRGHLLDFQQFMALVASGEVGNAPTILTAFWLAQNRERLRRV